MTRNRIALVTGATSGIGRAAALAMAEPGTTILVHGRDERRGEAVVEEVGARGAEARFLLADLSEVEGVTALADRVETEGEGVVDVLVHSAGIGAYGPTESVASDDLDRLWQVNVRAPFLLTGRLAPRMAERGRGCVVGIASIASGRGIDGFAAYSVTKAAITQLVLSWTAEYGKHGVRFNAVAPGAVDTPMIDGAEPLFESIAALGPNPRLATAEEVGAAVAWLCSPAANFVQGATVPVDGGWAAV